MITPSFALTATERVLPRMALDFTTASLDSRVTFTRAGNTATCVNSSGNVALVNADLPRFDFDPTTLVCKGLLIEEARTNTIRNNTMVGAVAGTPGTLPTNWLLINPTGLTSQVIGTGTETGISYLDVKISGTASSSGTIVFLYETSTGVPASQNQTWTNSQYLKIAAGSAANINLFRVYFQENNAIGGYINEQNTTITTPTTASLITQRSTASRTLVSALVTFLNTGVNFTVTAGAVVDITLRIGLPQLELGAFPTSVIPTSVAQVTRTADVATMTGTNFSNWFNVSEGAFGIEFIQPYNYAGNTYIFSCNSATDLEQLSFLTDTTPRAFWYCNAGGANVTVLAAGNITLNQTTKQVAAYKLDNYAMAVNGGTTATDTSAAVPSGLTTVYFGTNVSGGNRWSGWVRKLNFWPQRLINAELQAFSK
jgi:hypothetical protein